MTDQPQQRRRRQNAEAQRNYRDRQKARIQALEQMVVSMLANREPASVLNPHVPPASDLSRSHRPPARSSVNPRPSDASQILELQHSISREDIAKCLRVMAKENFTLRDVVKYGLIDLDRAMELSLFNGALNVPSRPWIEIVKSTYTDLNIIQVVTSGIRVLARLQNHPEWPSLNVRPVECPNLLAGTISLATMSYFSAKMLILQHLGLRPEAIIAFDSQSRFYNSKEEGASSEDPQLISAGELSRIAPDLLPTPLQMTMPHHPYLDLIPFPSLRTNVLTAISMETPAIDEDDFCLDMMNGGMRCWGSMLGSMHGRGEGVPWDSRSWEVMPWFLEKWKPLLGGENSDIFRTSAWWRTLQGTGYSEGLADAPPRTFACEPDS